LLRRGGYQTRDFGRATELLAAPSHVFQWSCVVSELSLPDMTGVDLVRSLRDRAIRVPVIVLTGQADVSTAVNALRNDVADFLLKPVIERDLLRRVETALVRHAGLVRTYS
jgi:FixJ family two-component response regulator